MSYIITIQTTNEKLEYYHNVDKVDDFETTPGGVAIQSNGETTFYPWATVWKMTIRETVKK
jgi:hypothetical protein